MLLFEAKRFLSWNLQYRAVLLIPYGSELFAVTCKQWYTARIMRQ
jgi:hypothetical protein